MAKDLGIAFQLAGTTRFGAVAEVLVNADYRKASDVAEEIIEMIINEPTDHLPYITYLYGLSLIEKIKEKYTGRRT
jgi:hypothetical protein